MTYYDILEVSENASEEVIKMAYKALAKKYHPDVFQGNSKEAEEKMKQLNEAFEILSNKEKRKEYDNNLRNKKNSASTENQHNTQPKPHPNNNKVEKQSKVPKTGIFILVFSIAALAIFGILNTLETTNNNESNSISNVISYTESKQSFSEWTEEKMEKSNFLDENIVFVIDGFDDYYYTYDEMVYVTQQMDEYTFWAYNKEQALSLDYVASNINVSNGWSSEKADFLDERIVFVIDGFGNYYYTYDEMIAATEQMDNYEYWAYNKEQAINLGYIHH